MKNNFLNLVGMSLACSMLSALAGDGGESERVISPKEKKSKSNGHWCESLEDLGKLYRNKDHDFVRKIQFFGRAHYQWGTTDGTFNNIDFDGNGGDLRRLRLGVEVDITRDLTLKGSVNLEKGGFRNPEFGYRSFDVLNLRYDFGDLGKVKNVEAIYGRQKIDIGSEGHQSSHTLKTIERSNLSNFFSPEKSTSLVVKAKYLDVKWTAGLISTAFDEVLAQWDEGVAYYLSGQFDVPGGELVLDGLYNSADRIEGETIDYQWVISAAYETEYKNFDLVVNGIYGETHGGEGVYGVIVMPSTYLVKDKLEAVLRYQYAKSDGDNLRVSERNVNNAHQNDRGFSIPRGNENHAIYAGLNYYLCGNRAKFMVGAEYEKLEGIGIGSSQLEADAFTFWTAFRLYF